MRFLFLPVLVSLLPLKAEALVCDYPEKTNGMKMTVQLVTQYDNLGILKIGTKAENRKPIPLYYVCHEQLDGAITCIRSLGESVDVVTILTARTLAVHASIDNSNPIKSHLNVENIVCTE